MFNVKILSNCRIRCRKSSKVAVFSDSISPCFGMQRAVNRQAGFRSDNSLNLDIFRGGNKIFQGNLNFAINVKNGALLLTLFILLTFFIYVTYSKLYLCFTIKPGITKPVDCRNIVLLLNPMSTITDLHQIFCFNISLLWYYS